MFCFVLILIMLSSFILFYLRVQYILFMSIFKSILFSNVLLFYYFIIFLII